MSLIGLLAVFMAFIFFLVFHCFFLCNKSHDVHLLKNWPFLGMLPGMLFNIPQFFAFKGPWFSGTDMLFTVDPRNINHMLSSNFANYPKGREYKKIFDIFGDGIVPTDLEKLVYLHAALSEAMRLYPPVPFNHKSPSKTDVLPSGHKVEADSKIVISIYALGRMRSVWGEDASDFRPERWISENGGLKSEPSSKFLVFNAGPRTCLGKQLAFFQMKMVALEIIQNYDFKVVEGQKIEPVPSIILRMKHGLKVRVSKNI